MNEKEKIQQLLDNFWEVCAFCDELDIYERRGLDEAMQDMQQWVNETFGRKIE